MDDNIRSQPTGQPYIINLRHEQAGQDGGDAARGAVDYRTCQGLDVQRVVQGNEGVAGHVWPGQQASGAILENTGMLNNPQMIYQYYPYQYYTM